MTGQSSTSFMKLSDKKSKKTVLFDAREVFERNSKNMELNDSTYGQDVYKTRSERCVLQAADISKRRKRSE